MGSITILNKLVRRVEDQIKKKKQGFRDEIFPQSTVQNILSEGIF